MQTPGDLALAGQCAIAGLAEERDETRGMAANFMFERRSRVLELMPRQLACTGRWPCHQGGQSATVVQQGGAVLRGNFMGRETGQMHGAPETIAAIGKMQAEGCRALARVDAAEQYVQVVGEEVVESIIHAGSSMLIGVTNHRPLV